MSERLLKSDLIPRSLAMEILWGLFKPVFGQILWSTHPLGKLEAWLAGMYTECWLRGVLFKPECVLVPAPGGVAAAGRLSYACV